MGFMHYFKFYIEQIKDTIQIYFRVKKTAILGQIKFLKDHEPINNLSVFHFRAIPIISDSLLTIFLTPSPHPRV